MTSEMENNILEIERYRRKDNLIRRKLSEYVPVMIVTNISLLLINTVDKIIAGNYVGAEAMNSISIFFPVLLVTSAFSAIVGNGIATSLSNAMGDNDTENIARIKGISLRIMILSAIITSIVQIPIIWVIVTSYNVSDELSSMIWQYAIGCMICTPISIVSSVGTLQIQMIGKMKLIMNMTLLEGFCNVCFDLLFVAVLDMGVAGAGFGTACSNMVRCTVTVIYLSRKTDFYKKTRYRLTVREAWAVLARGLPDASNFLVLAFQNYFTLLVILKFMGEEGGVVYGVCSFCMNMVNVLISGIQGGVRPLLGLYAGADDKKGLSKLMFHGVILVVICAGAASLAIILFPDIFYQLHGVDQIPEGGDLSIQLYSLSFVIMGFNYLLRLYFTNRGDITFATTLTLIGRATLPLFAFGIAIIPGPPAFIFIAYLFMETLTCVPGVVRYFHRKSIDRREDLEDIVLYMTIERDDAADAAHNVRRFAEEHGIERGTAFRISVCMEEMTAYIRHAEKLTYLPPDVEKFYRRIQKNDLLVKISSDAKEFFDSVAMSKAPASLYGGVKEFNELIQKSGAYASLPIDAKEVIDDAIKKTETFSQSDPKPITVDITIRFQGSNRAILVTLDDGDFIALDPDEEKQQLITDNYELIKKLANDVEYQYILNMNYTKILVDRSE